MLPEGIFSTPTYRDDITLGTVRQPQMERCGEAHCTSYCKNCWTTGNPWCLISFRWTNQKDKCVNKDTNIHKNSYQFYPFP